MLARSGSQSHPPLKNSRSANGILGLCVLISPGLPLAPSIGLLSVKTEHKSVSFYGVLSVLLSRPISWVIDGETGLATEMRFKPRPVGRWRYIRVDRSAACNLLSSACIAPVHLPAPPTHVVCDVTHAVIQPRSSASCAAAAAAAAWKIISSLLRRQDKHVRSAAVCSRPIRRRF